MFIVHKYLVISHHPTRAHLICHKMQFMTSQWPATQSSYIDWVAPVYLSTGENSIALSNDRRTLTPWEQCQAFTSERSHEGIFLSKLQKHHSSVMVLECHRANIQEKLIIISMFYQNDQCLQHYKFKFVISRCHYFYYQELDCLLFVFIVF